MGQPPVSVLDALACPDDTAAYLAMTAPGPDAAGPLAALDPERLTQPGRVDALVAIERQMAWLAGLQQRILATMTAHDAAKSGDQWVREDVACALRLSGLTAQRRIAAAQTLAESLPATLALLESGAISYLHALNLAEAVYPLDAKTAAAVEERVLARAGEQTLSQFKASVRRAVASAAPARTEQQREQALAERRVCISAREDGMAELWALLPAEGAAAVMTAVDALASVSSADDPRSTDQRRRPRRPRRRRTARPAAAPRARPAPDHPGQRRAVHPARLRPATRRTHRPRTHTRVGGPAAGGRPHRHLAETRHRPHRRTARLRHHHLPPTRQPHGIRYRPRPNLHLPGCRRPAHRCDLDHQTPASEGGATSADNLATLCRRHHRAKHQAGWRVARHQTASHWTSPTGHRYTSTPPPYPSDRTPDSDPDPPPF